MLLGHELTHVRDAVTLTTFWRVTATADRPLSLMAHRINMQGTTLTVADGLSVTPENWQPGDVIVQRHVFPSEDATKETRAYLIGAYWLDTMERWQAVCGKGCTSTTWLIPQAIE